MVELDIKKNEKIKNAGLAESLATDIVNKAVNDYYNLEIKYYETLLQWDKEYSIQYYNYWFYNNDFESSSIRDYDSNALPFIASELKRKNDKHVGQYCITSAIIMI